MSPDDTPEEPTVTSAVERMTETQQVEIMRRTSAVYGRGKLPDQHSWERRIWRELCGLGLASETHNRHYASFTLTEHGKKVRSELLMRRWHEPSK